MELRPQPCRTPSEHHRRTPAVTFAGPVFEARRQAGPRHFLHAEWLRNDPDRGARRCAGRCAASSNSSSRTPSGRPWKAPAVVFSGPVFEARRQAGPRRFLSAEWSKE
jgi:hypothetical protein